jgi:hypothetical protein
MEYKAVESSQIEAVAHDPQTNTLGIRFHPNKKQKEAGERGSEYHYANVDDVLFNSLRNAVSVGQHFGQYIKAYPDHYPYKRVS